MALSGIDASNINAVLPAGTKYAGQPVFTERVRTDFASPQIQAALKSGGSSKVKIGDTEYTISGGKIQSMKTGGIVKPLLVAGAIATGGIALPAALSAGGGAAAGGGGLSLAGVEGAASAPISAGMLGGAAAPTVGTITTSGLGTTIANKVGGALLSPTGISTLGSIFGTIFGANQQAGASRDQLAYLQQKDKQDQANWEAAQAEARRQFDTTQQLNLDQYNAREGRLAPYRQLGESAASTLADWLGFPAVSRPAMTPNRAAATPRAAPSGPIPQSTGDLNKDLALANQITGGNHTDPAYWAKAGYAKDPQYFFQKMLGMDAGGADVPKMGPYAGVSAAPAVRPPMMPMPADAPRPMTLGTMANLAPIQPIQTIDPTSLAALIQTRSPRRPVFA